MPPEIAQAPIIHERADHAGGHAWRGAFITMVIAAAILVIITAREWGEMMHQWWNIDTYSHILLVPLIMAWLVALKRDDLANATPRPWGAGLVLVAAGLGLWLAGRASGINLIAHAGAVGALQGVVVAVLGPRVSLILALPIAFGAFLVPFGDEIIAPLQAITAEIAIALTKWSGIPARIDGIYIDTPAGLFVVAEACSGVRFLIAMVTLAVLVCFTRFKSWSRRCAFMAAAIIVPVIANGIRAWGTIYIAQSQGVEFAAGFDHIVYGWFFFAIVLVVVLAASWRFFERDPDDFGWSAQQVDQFALLPRLERGFTSPVVLIAAVAALGLISARLAAIVTPAALG
ncbi:MAG: exosortase A [Erythrobacter sp.]|nr:exosortase A [Erythrobacter sp.]